MTTSTSVRFTVVGSAVPKGSYRAFGWQARDESTGKPVVKNGKPVIRARSTADNPNVKGWETNVRSAAQQQCPGIFFEGAVRLGIVFFLPRPQSLPQKVKHHTKKPDVDKLVRAVKDALTGVLWRDDSQVIELVARKGYATTQPHARIVVEPAEAIEEIALEQDLFAGLDSVRA